MFPPIYSLETCIPLSVVVHLALDLSLTHPLFVVHKTSYIKHIRGPEVPKIEKELCVRRFALLECGNANLDRIQIAPHLTNNVKASTISLSFASDGELARLCHSDAVTLLF